MLQLTDDTCINIISWQFSDKKFLASISFNLIFLKTIYIFYSINYNNSTTREILFVVDWFITVMDSSNIVLLVGYDANVLRGQ